MQAMVDIDQARAVGALSLQLQRSDNETRAAIIDMLERIAHPLAEDALIEVVKAPDWQGERLHQRLAAITALGKRGTEKSLDVLQRLAHGYILLLTRGGRQVRSTAGEALEQLRARRSGKGG
jgi:HEAT repeat protein